MWENEKLSLKIVIAQVAIVQNTMIASSIVGVLYLKYYVTLVLFCQGSANSFGPITLTSQTYLLIKSLTHFHTNQWLSG